MMGIMSAYLITLFVLGQLCGLHAKHIYLGDKKLDLYTITGITPTGRKNTWADVAEADLDWFKDYLRSPLTITKQPRTIDMSIFIDNHMDCTFSMYDGTEWYNGRLTEIKINEHGDTWYIAENGYGYKYCTPRFGHWNYRLNGWDYSVIPHVGFDTDTALDSQGEIIGVSILCLKDGWEVQS